ncbi:MAG: hypothetical protein IT233_00945 [Bacteroidia bacterium]|nr:hypothetical protein [Bacteroidia bacterium]
MNAIVYLILLVAVMLVIPITKSNLSAAPKRVSKTSHVQTDSIAIRNSQKKWPLWQLGICTIIETDGSEIRRAVIKEIHDYWVVYEKEGSLHDIMIEKIGRIQLGSDKACSVFFDSIGKPYIWYN